MRIEPAQSPGTAQAPLSQPLYLAYALDPDKTAFSVRRLDAWTDASACAAAATIPNLHGTEVWDCNRFVRRLPGTAQG